MKVISLFLSFSFFLSFFFSFFLSIFLSFYLSIFLSFYLSIFLSIFLSINQSLSLPSPHLVNQLKSFSAFWFNWDKSIEPITQLKNDLCYCRLLGGRHIRYWRIRYYGSTFSCVYFQLQRRYFLSVSPLDCCRCWCGFQKKNLNARPRFWANDPN